MVVDVSSCEDILDWKLEQNILEKFVSVEDCVSRCAGGAASSDHCMVAGFWRVGVARDCCERYRVLRLEAAGLYSSQ